MEFLKAHGPRLLGSAGALSILGVLAGRRFFLDGIIDNGLSVKSRNKDLTDHYAIVTGANRGIGRELTKLLVQRGCNVVLGCRSRDKAESTIESITAELSADKKSLEIKPGKLLLVTSDNGTFCPLELDSLASVSRFVAAYIAMSLPLHFLVNNAADQSATYTATADGMERIWQINYASSTLLLHSLLPLLVASVHADPRRFAGRAVAVTSKGHIHCAEVPYALWDGTVENGSAAMSAAQSRNGVDGEYHATKMAQIMHTKRLQRELDAQVNDSVDSECRVDAVSVHPGLVNTDIFKWHEKPIAIRAAVTLLSPWLLMLTRSTTRAAECVLHCLVADRDDEHFEPGGYHSNCRPFEPGYGRAETRKLMTDEKLEELWNATHTVLGLKPLKLQTSSKL